MLLKKYNNFKVQIFTKLSYAHKYKKKTNSVIGILRHLKIYLFDEYKKASSKAEWHIIES